MAAIQGRKAELWVISGAGSAITKEACENVSGYIYHVTDATKRYLSPETTILVYGNDILVTSGYTIKGGCQIHFDAAPATPVTLTGAYLTPAEVSLVQNWELNLESEVYETTSLGSTTRTYMGSGLLGWSGSFERFYEDNTWGARAAANATKLLIRCFTDQPSGYVYTGWVVPNQWTQTTPMELERENFTFTGDGYPVYSTDET